MVPVTFRDTVHRQLPVGCSADPEAAFLQLTCSKYKPKLLNQSIDTRTRGAKLENISRRHNFSSTSEPRLKSCD